METILIISVCAMLSIGFSASNNLHSQERTHKDYYARCMHHIKDSGTFNIDDFTNDSPPTFVCTKVAENLCNKNGCVK
jgi:hypothetical protein